MNFKDYLQAVAMLLPTLLLIVAVIVTLALPAKASAAACLAGDYRSFDRSGVAIGRAVSKARAARSTSASA